MIVPDVLLQPHDASLEMTFYDGAQFPDAYRGDIFAARARVVEPHWRSGYEVVRVPMHGRARATGEYEDFLTGFVTASGDVWGRPVGVAVAAEGALHGLRRWLELDLARQLRRQVNVTDWSA